MNIKRLWLLYKNRNKANSQVKRKKRRKRRKERKIRVLVPIGSQKHNQVLKEMVYLEVKD